MLPLPVIAMAPPLLTTGPESARRCLGRGDASRPRRPWLAERRKDNERSRAEQRRTPTTNVREGEKIDGMRSLHHRRLLTKIATIDKGVIAGRIGDAETHDDIIACFAYARDALTSEKLFPSTA